MCVIPTCNHHSANGTSTFLSAAVAQRHYRLYHPKYITLLHKSPPDLCQYLDWHQCPNQGCTTYCLGPTNLTDHQQQCPFTQQQQNQQQQQQQRQNQQQQQQQQNQQQQQHSSTTSPSAHPAPSNSNKRAATDTSNVATAPMDTDPDPFAIARKICPPEHLSLLNQAINSNCTPQEAFLLISSVISPADNGKCSN